MTTKKIYAERHNKEKMLLLSLFTKYKLNGRSKSKLWIMVQLDARPYYRKCIYTS